MIAIGTLCLTVRNAEFAWLNGRVVEVADYFDVDQDGAVWHQLSAEWLPAIFGERTVVLAREWNLLPICPPGIAPLDAQQARTRVPH